MSENSIIGLDILFKGECKLSENRSTELFREYGSLCASTWIVRDTEEFWDWIVEQVESLCKRYSETSLPILCKILLEELELEAKLLKCSESQAVSIPVRKGTLRMYGKIFFECYEILGELHQDLKLLKVYSDVNFYRLMGKIEDYLEDIGEAESYFPQKMKCRGHDQFRYKCCLVI